MESVEGSVGHVDKREWKRIEKGKENDFGEKEE